NPEHLRPNYGDQAVILLAEDDVIVANIVRISLERAGYFVLTSEDGEEALTISRQYPGRIHMLLSDIQMPKMDGVRLAEFFAKERPDTRVLLMSGHSNEPIRGYAFLAKPFRLAQLLDAVTRLVSARPPDDRRAHPD